MNRIILTVFISVVILLNVHAQVNYHITGTIERKGIDKVYLVIVGEGNIDSATVKTGTFEMKGNYKSQSVAFIVTQTPRSGSKIILDNGEYNVKLDAHLKPNIESTSINHNLWKNNLNSDELQTNEKAKDSLFTDYSMQIAKGNYDQSAQYIEKYHDIQLRVLNYYKKLVSDHPDCYIIPYLLEGETILTQENFGDTFNQLSLEVKNNKWGQQLKTSLEKKTTIRPDKNLLYFTMLGNKAHFFESKLENGNNFDLASLKGKWV